METNEIFTAIGDIGFPIVVSIYLLLRLEGKMSALIGSIDQLGQIIREHDNRQKG